MFEATGESRFIRLAVRLARPVKIVLTLAVCGWVAWDVHRKLTVRPTPLPVDQIELPRLPGSEDRPDVTDELREALSFFSRNSPFLANQTIFPDDALGGPWVPSERAELRLIIRHLEGPKVRRALDRVSRLSSGTLRMPAEEFFEDFIPLCAQTMQFARHMVPRARKRWEGQNAPEEAWVDITATYNMARILYGRPLAVHHLVAGAIEQLAHGEFLRLLMHHPPPAPLCDRMAADFEALRLPQRGLFAFVNRGEGCFRERFIDMCYTNNGRGDGWLDLSATHQSGGGGAGRSRWWNLGSCFFNSRRRVLAKNERWTRAWVDIDFPDVAAALNRLDRMAETHRPWTVLDFPLGNTLTPAGPDGPMERREYVIMASLYTRREAVRAGLALASFRTTHGDYPDRLEQLVPEFLPELPRDLFDGQPLRYRRDGAGYRLYSVYKNRRDDGGINSFPNAGGAADQVYFRPRGPLSSPMTVVPGFAWDSATKRYKPVRAPVDEPGPRISTRGGSTMMTRPLIPQATPRRYATRMFDALGESRVVRVAVRLARPAKVVVTLAVCGWLAWDVYRKLTVRPRPGPADQIELPRLPGSDGRPDVTDEMREALGFFSKNNPFFANQTLWPSEAFAGPWEPAERPELRLIIRHLESPKVRQALDRVGGLSAGALRICNEDLFAFRDFSSYSAARRFALHMLPRARLRWEGQDDAKRGWADFMAVFHVVRMLYEQPTTVSHVIAMGIEQMAQGQLLHLVMDCPPPEALCEQMAADLEALALPQRGLLAFVARVDGRFRERLIDICYTNDGRGGGWPDLSTAYQAWNGGPERSPWWNLGSCFLNDRGAVLAKNERWTRALVDADLPDVPAALVRLDRLTEAHRSWTVVDFPAEFTLFPGGTAGPREQRRYIMMATVYTGREAIRAGLALAAFRIKRKAYPDRLEELAPEFLPELPKDLFDGQPLRYRRDGVGYRLYSVSQNRRDDGGVAFDPDTHTRLDYVHAGPRPPQSSPAMVVPGFAWDPGTKRYERVRTPSTNPAPTSRPAEGSP